MASAWRWSDDLAAAAALDADDTALERVLEEDRQRLTERLRDLYAAPHLQRAVHVASTSVAGSLRHWLEHPQQDADPRLVQTLASYLLRMACRPTPFGLFAGCATIAVAGSTRLELPDGAQPRSHSRLDVVYLDALCRALAAAPDVREHLVWRPNPALYQVAGQYRLAELVRGAEETQRTFHLVGIEASEPLLRVLRAAAGGATLAQLNQVLKADFADVTDKEADAFLGELVASQILLSDLEPCVSGADALSRLITTLEQVAGQQPEGTAARVTRRLVRVRTDLAEMDTDATPIEVCDRRITEQLQQIGVAVPTRHHLHVDLYRPGQGLAVGRDVVGTVARTIDLLHGICPPAVRGDLASFVSEFQSRYQDREVPLMEALDEDLGIGFGRAPAEATENSALLSGLGIRRRSGGDLPWRDGDAVRLRLLGAALGSGAATIELNQTDIDQLAVPDHRALPAALAANVTVIGGSREAVAQGDFELLWHGAFGPSGALYLGRFCHGDPELYAAVQRHLQAEERTRPEALFAEIVHLPQDKIGNVICRPRLRAWQIPYHGSTDAPAAEQIPVTDLRVSVVDGRVVLRSERLDREVIPRLTTAHNAAQAELGPYRFLCALQTQGVCHWLAWDWGVLESAVYLPRVKAGRVILCRARWRLDEQMLKGLAAKRSAARFRALRRLRDELGLPRWVQVVQADRLLPLDLDNVVCVDALARLTRGQAAVDLTEMLPLPDCAALSGPDGRYNHELVIPFVQSEAPPAPAPRVAPRPRRLHVPGGDWLYLKVYGGAGELDRLLCGPIARFVRSEADAGTFTRWHFIRYADPHPHLRLRFHGAPAPLAGLSGRFHGVLAEAVARGAVWRVQIDSYDPEVERYGGERGMALAERLFHEDSNAALGLLELCADDPDARWSCALLSIDGLFEDLQVGLPARIERLSGMRDGLTGEFDLADSARRGLARKHRELKDQLEAVLTPAPDDPFTAARRVLERRTRGLREIGAGLRAAADQGALSVDVDELSLSYAHMAANRLLRAAARAQELVLYELLIRHYRTELERAARRQ